ncbi:DUF2809 domain-containing protein [Sedimentibacter hydroxybenzoicus DSM 7310]|uniref:DUF2809 domain-containing protein n=1 Tax=Sedimentibacter hydroxybenzoicus DSM 7310 TaxID=1123245 RepID=A0A974BI82_SEDHY|nr:DUF2809 domain-containing protein [Sedimentibacter hydroxybenzoicus]NYB73573.1 DUF2809 domain-containing protein [Sedimentibacter hydroxybenzoicus DSM 7310]
MNTYEKSKTKYRIKYAAAFILLVLAEVFIALYVHDNFIRPYVGDILVVVVIYCAVRTLFPNKITLLPLWIFLFAVFVEFLQYVGIVSILGLNENEFFRVLMGSVFDWKDIICYGIGFILLVVYEKRIYP